MSTFTTTVRHGEDGVVIVALHGYLDAHTASEFERELRALIQGGASRIIVDFSDLEYISSAGLGVFMVFIEDVRRDHGDILLASMRENVFSVFDLLGFQVLFTITTTVDQAQQEFRSRR